MDKNYKNVPHGHLSPMVDEENGIVAISPFPNRAERRKTIRLRSGFTRTPILLKKIRRVIKNTKQKTSLPNKVRSIINNYKLQFANG